MFNIKRSRTVVRFEGLEQYQEILQVTPKLNDYFVSYINGGSRIVKADRWVARLTRGESLRHHGLRVDFLFDVHREMQQGPASDILFSLQVFQVFLQQKQLLSFHAKKDAVLGGVESFRAKGATKTSIWIVPSRTA